MADANRPRMVFVNRYVALDSSGRFLLIQREPTDSHEPSRWELPGGKVEEGDDPEHAGIDEFMQETGLVVKPTTDLVCRDDYTIGMGRHIGLPYTVLTGIARVIGGRLQLSNEHTDSAWVTYDEALGYDLTFAARKAIVTLGAVALNGSELIPRSDPE